jgi:hypothetical protein
VSRIILNGNQAPTSPGPDLALLKVVARGWRSTSSALGRLSWAFYYQPEGPGALKPNSACLRNSPRHDSWRMYSNSHQHRQYPYRPPVYLNAIMNSLKSPLFGHLATTVSPVQRPARLISSTWRKKSSSVQT